MQPGAQQGGASAFGEQGAFLPTELGLIRFVLGLGKAGLRVGHPRRRRVG